MKYRFLLIGTADVGDLYIRGTNDEKQALEWSKGSVPISAEVYDCVTGELLTDFREASPEYAVRGIERVDVAPL